MKPAVMKYSRYAVSSLQNINRITRVLLLAMLRNPFTMINTLSGIQNCLHIIEASILHAIRQISDTSPIVLCIFLSFHVSGTDMVRHWNMNCGTQTNAIALNSIFAGDDTEMYIITKDISIVKTTPITCGSIRNFSCPSFIRYCEPAQNDTGNRLPLKKYP